MGNGVEAIERGGQKFRVLRPSENPRGVSYVAV
jgi:hypothetical protein